MNSELFDLLKNVAFEADGNSFTHITTYDTIKRWGLKYGKYDEFWKKYCELVEKNEPNLCLAERISNEIPLIVNMKFKFNVIDENENGNENFFDKKFLIYICHIYQTIIIENFKVDSEYLIELIVAVLESKTNYIEVDNESNKRYLISNIKLQFPFAKIDIGLQKRLIRARAIKLLTENNGFKYFNQLPIGDWDDIILDDYDSPVMMYGSSQSPNQPLLSITNIWPWITIDMIEEDDIPEELTIGQVFDPTNHKHFRNGSVNPEIFDDYDKDYWIPVYLSLNYWPTIMFPKEEDNERFNIPVESKININFGNKWSHHSTDEKKIDICEQLLPLINKERFFNESSWLDIGKALYSADMGKQSACELWSKFTQKVLDSDNRNTPKYMLTTGNNLLSTCKTAFRTFSKQQITEKTIAYYARLDDNDKYSEWHKNWSVDAICKSINFSHADVANAVWKVYWLDFIYCPETKMWYYFDYGKWNIDVDALHLSEMITGDFIRRMEAVQASIKAQVKNSHDEKAIETGSSTVQKLDALIIKLKNMPFLANVIKALKFKFNNYKFSIYSDSNPNLLGVANGVLEVVTNHIQFRPAKPEDYILLNTNVPYQDDFTWESDLVVECMEWFTKVFPDEKLKHHFLKFAASCIKGRNSDKIFPIFTGEGNNSKSMIVKLFMSTFGEYAIKFDMSNVTGRNNNPGSASPHLARAKSVRLGFMDEAADDVPIHKETVKRVVGGDSFYTRKLHDNGGDIEVFFKLILSCNKVPIIPKADKAIKNRTRLFPFDSTWDDNVDEKGEIRDGKHYFKNDPLFENRIVYLAPAFLWILVNYYPYYAVEKLPDPPIVKAKTDAYWENNDVYAQFAGDCIDKNKDVNSKVSFTEIYTKFRMWFRDSFDGVKVPEKPIVKMELQAEARLGRLSGQYWYGISIVQEAYGKDPRPVAQQTQPVAQQTPQPTAAQKVETKVEVIKESKMAESTMSVIIDNEPKAIKMTETALSVIKEINEPEAIKIAKKFDEFSKKVKKDKNKDIQEFVGDLTTRFLSPGIIADESKEIIIDDDGAIDF